MSAGLIELGAIETQSEIQCRNGLQKIAFRLAMADSFVGFYGFAMNAPKKDDLESAVPTLVGMGSIIVGLTVFQIFSHINQRRIQSLERHLKGTQTPLPEPESNNRGRFRLFRSRHP